MVNPGRAAGPSDPEGMTYGWMVRDSRRSKLVIPAVIALVAFAALLVTESDIGLTWDEPDYIAASEAYVSWLEALLQRPGYALSDEGIERYWTVNHEHPPVDKIWSGIVWRAASPVLSDLTAHRLGNMLLSSLCLALVTYLVQEPFGRWAGLAASLSLFTMPRFFFHSHLAALDVPAAALTVATATLFWKTRESKGWSADVLLGVLWGTAVGTKINAVFLLPTLALWVVLFDRRWRSLLRLLVMGGVAVGVFFVSWPWLYRHTVERTLEYVRFLTVDHWEIGQWYLNRFYMPPPWHFPFVITAAVVPAALLALFFVGAGRVLGRARERKIGGFLVINALTPLVVVAVGQSMVYDNDRLFMPAMPFIAGLSGVGLETVAGAIRARVAGTRARRVAIGAVAAAAFAPQVLAAASLYPHLLSYYSHLVGGVSGATELGLETTYWCETYSEVLDYLNQNAREGAVVWVAPGSHNVMIYYQLHGRLREDLRFTAHTVGPSILDDGIVTIAAPFQRADWVVFQNRQTTFGAEGLDSELARWLDRRVPGFQVRYGGTPLIAVYRNAPW
jgi:4-amino-4-deoxy-L-arabinose transferase-like glycosyltransferase